MGILKSIIKNFASKNDEPSKEPEIIVKVVGEKVDEAEEESGAENYLRYLRTVRKEQGRPQVEKMDVSEKFYSYSGCEFDFSDVPVARFKNGVNWYLLDEVNADKVFDDIAEFDNFAFQAEQIADVPDFRVPLMDILLNPEWIENGFDMEWKMSYFSPQPLTKTGKSPKYPIKVLLVSRSGNYEARLKYNQQDKIGEAEIRVGDLGRSWHTMTVRDRKIIRIMRHEGLENFPVYSDA